MSYTLYVAENCHQCGEVMAYMDRKEVSFRKVNVDLTEERPPIQIFAFPALFEENELLGYGTDIISYFMKKSRNTNS